ILKDHLHAPAQAEKLGARHLIDVLAVEQDLASGRPFEPQDAAAGCRLATAAFADQPQGLAAFDAKVDAVHRLHLADLAAQRDALGHREMHGKRADLQERLAVGYGHPAASSAATNS